MFGYVAGLPAFLGYFFLGLIFYGVFTAVYTALTPQKESELIRSGNIAAVTAFLGALLGFGFALSSAAANSVSIIDFGLWALIGLIVQILAFFLASATMSKLHERITNGEVAAGIWTGGIALGIGLLNAACMVY